MVLPAGRTVHVRVPATSANLGPGFDALGIALALHDDVVVRTVDSGFVVEVSGEGADAVARDESNLVLSALRTGLEAFGTRVGGLVLQCTNRIPHGRGLGSSAAAIVAGLAAARCLAVGASEDVPVVGDDALLELAGEIEGHPDNVAAALLGGFTIAWLDSGHARGVRLEPHAALRARVLVPAEAVSTKVARGLLPTEVLHADAARNAGRAALLVEAMTRRPDLLLSATEDRLHQTYRGPAMPATLALVERLRAAGTAAVVSGAGPTVLALGTDEALSRADVAAQGFDLLTLEIDRSGVLASVVRDSRAD